MVKKIGNPRAWSADTVIGTGRTVGAAAEALGSEETAPPETRKITNDDIRDALRKGYDDFKTCRSDVMFLVGIYPIIGICLMVISFDMTLLPPFFPLAAGFFSAGPGSRYLPL